MRIQNGILLAAALGAAGALLLPASTNAFSTIGGNLSTAQRDFRIFNNFTDSTANNNTAADSQFPGYQGAAMAMWKSIVEWGSRLHGNGNGDTTQPGGLGSGGANFDAVWQGYALGVGGANENIASELAGSDGGTLAFTETPISDGWRIRYYSTWTWHDGPGSVTSGIDIQGVNCHEYGHALGLGHSTVSGATMFPSISGTGTAQRSIAADDIAGVQFIYGVASATKPIISSISVGLGTVTIFGSNFAASNNQVWFTQAAAGGTGAPVTVMNVASTGGGTQITVSVPPSAGPGDVLVKLPTAGHATLSNAFPFQPGVCPPVVNYCFTSPNSFDPIGAIIGYSGSTSVAANDFTLITSGVPPGAAGIYYYGQNQTFASFGNGFRCVGSPTTRLPIINANAFGDAVYALNLPTLPPTGQISAGQTWNFQLWYRNPAGGGAGFNLSDGLEVPWCP